MFDIFKKPKILWVCIIYCTSVILASTVNSLEYENYDVTDSYEYNSDQNQEQLDYSIFENHEQNMFSFSVSIDKSSQWLASSSPIDGGKINIYKKFDEYELHQNIQNPYEQTPDLKSDNYFGYELNFYNSTHLIVGNPSKYENVSGNIYIYSYDNLNDIWKYDTTIDTIIDNNQFIDYNFGSNIKSNSDLKYFVTTSSNLESYVIAPENDKWKIKTRFGKESGQNIGIRNFGGFYIPTNYPTSSPVNSMPTVNSGMFGYPTQSPTTTPQSNYNQNNYTYSHNYTNSNNYTDGNNNISNNSTNGNNFNFTMWPSTSPVYTPSPTMNYTIPNYDDDNHNYNHNDEFPWYPNYFKNDSSFKMFFEGKSISNYVNGNNILIGDIGNSRVYVYNLDYNYSAELVTTIYSPSGEINDGFGTSIIMIDNKILIGAPYTSAGGNAYGFQLETIYNYRQNGNETNIYKKIVTSYLGSLPNRESCSGNIPDYDNGNGNNNDNHYDYPYCNEYGCYYPPNWNNTNPYPPYCSEHGCYYPPNSNDSSYYPPWCTSSSCYYPPNSNGTYPYPPNYNSSDRTWNDSNIYEPWCNEYVCYLPPWNGDSNYTYPPWCIDHGCYYPIYNSSRLIGNDPSTWTPTFNHTNSDYRNWTYHDGNRTYDGNWTNPDYGYGYGNNTYPPYCKNSSCYYPPWCGPDGCHYAPIGNWTDGNGSYPYPPWCGPDGCYYPPWFGNWTDGNSSYPFPWRGDRPCDYNCPDCHNNCPDCGYNRDDDQYNHEDKIIVCDSYAEFAKSLGTFRIDDGTSKADMIIIGISGIRTVGAYILKDGELHEQGTLPIETNEWFSFGSDIEIGDNTVIISAPYSNEGNGMFMALYLDNLYRNSSNNYDENNNSGLGSTITPTTTPTMTPTIYPTDHPTFRPSPQPTSRPTMSVPTSRPTLAPTNKPTTMPTRVPTSMPTGVPSNRPTSMPTSVPTNRPTGIPTNVPTSMPTKVPTNRPTSMPTSVPTSRPTVIPTNVPTSMPTKVPTNRPTGMPTNVPTNRPTVVPSGKPTFKPSGVPTGRPTVAPSTSKPSGVPSGRPTIVPTGRPTLKPSGVPSGRPTLRPSTTKPSGVPSGRPTLRPSTTKPSVGRPTVKPSVFPTVRVG